MVLKFLVDNFVHYIAHYKIPTMHSKFQCTYDEPYILFLYTTMQCSCVFSKGEVARKPVGFAKVRIC